MPIYKVRPATTCTAAAGTPGNGAKHPLAANQEATCRPGAPSNIGDETIGEAGSDRSDSSTFADLTEADRDSELLRRDLEEKVHRCQTTMNHQNDEVTQNSVANGNVSESGRRRTNNAIDKEITAQQRREDELASTRQSTCQNSQLASSSSHHSSTVVAAEVDAINRHVSRPPCNPLGTDQLEGKDVGSQYAHPGESLIVRELMELRQRERELRGRWKEMGFVLPEATGENETPFTLPEPRPISTKTVHTKVESDFAAAPSTVPACSRKEVVCEKGTKVQPFDDPDIGSDRKLAYVPANETPIEREIRLAREREDALRLARGLSPLNGSDSQGTGEGRDVEIAVDPPSSYFNGGNPHVTDPNVKVSMKKLASNRLQLEILKERERELALKSEGAIHTLSEERAGDPVKYVEVISMQPPIQALSPTRPRNPSVNSTIAGPTYLTTKANAEVGETKTPSEKEVPVTPGGRPKELLSHSRSVEPQVNELESVFDGRQKQQLLKSKSSAKPTAAERKILNELKEMQLREEELKNLRHLSTSSSCDPSSSDSPSTESVVDGNSFIH